MVFWIVYHRIAKEGQVIEESKANKAVFTNYARDLVYPKVYIKKQPANPSQYYD